MEKLMFTKVREVKSPNRANSGDAGIDFYVPQLNIRAIESIEVNRVMLEKEYLEFIPRKGEEGISDLKVIMKPGSRLLIPSGIRVLIDPMESMLMVANKSGVSTKLGLIYTAEIIDSPYTGEVHIGILNPGPEPVSIPLKTNMKIIQLIHVPIILSTPVEVTYEQYITLAENWGTRGSNGFGSSDNK